MTLWRAFLVTFVICLDTVSTFGFAKHPVVRSKNLKANNILILDHLNINHEKGRHDWLKAFYFEILGCAIDPRKEENLLANRKTLWANCGSQQFHLSEGSPDAQVFDGVVTLSYESLSSVKQRLAYVPAVLDSSKFSWKLVHEGIFVTDPWGTKFMLIEKNDFRGE